MAKVGIAKRSRTQLLSRQRTRVTRIENHGQFSSVDPLPPVGQLRAGDGMFQKLLSLPTNSGVRWVGKTTAQDLFSNSKAGSPVIWNKVESSVETALSV